MYFGKDRGGGQGGNVSPLKGCGGNSSSNEPIKKNPNKGYVCVHNVASECSFATIDLVLLALLWTLRAFGSHPFFIHSRGVTHKPTWGQGAPSVLSHILNLTYSSRDAGMSMLGCRVCHVFPATCYSLQIR